MVRTIFLSENFLWNNIDNSELGLIICTMESDILNTYGLAYTDELEWEETFNNYPYYKKSTNQPETINLKFFLVDANSQPLVWNDFKLQEICSLFITDEFKPFVSYDNLDNVYYLKATRIEKVFNSARQGYLDITFQPYNKYCYKKQVNKVIVNGEKEFTIVNYSNLDELYAPIITIKNLGTLDTVNSVLNTSLSDESLEIKGLETNETITIDNLMLSVVDELGNNKFMHQNRKWVKLRQGLNKIKIVGNCEVEFKMEFPLIR